MRTINLILLPVLVCILCIVHLSAQTYSDFAEVNNQGISVSQLGLDAISSTGNSIILNPGITGSREAFNLNASYQREWVSFPGAPSTILLSAHMPLNNKKIALGGSVFMDKAGIVSYSGMQFSFAYRLPFKNGNISMGLSAGMANYQVKLNSASSSSAYDPILGSDIGIFSSNAGFGAYYYTPKYYAGVSVPELFKTSGSNTVSITDNRAGFVFMGGYVFELDNIQLKPEMNVAINPQGDNVVSTGFSAGLPVDLWVGIWYHTAGSIDATLEYELIDKVSFRYTYKHSTAKIAIGDLGTHMLSFGVDLPNKKTPRRESGKLGYYF
jgi:type IX secretion system PorP/SprF family membrane protein